jgi:hypothetical protein
MEVRWLVLVGAWKTCVTIDLRYSTTPDHLLAGAGKSVLWFVLLWLFHIHPTHYFQLLNYRRYHGFARCWKGLDSLLLF